MAEPNLASNCIVTAEDNAAAASLSVILSGVLQSKTQSKDLTIRISRIRSFDCEIIPARICSVCKLTSLVSGTFVRSFDFAQDDRICIGAKHMPALR